ncbi:ligase-associated DNA damage response endonuclease PdeM [Algoriphagus sp. CAU 1675]|uniref:ligase-associated DNA damage response endonuclease PdeM n=1 Tax=Algoriphagus sp. CAU 1675 TaxID=3032597 RepID=UPI0023DB5F8B|nr:ligase-associated DNA damage response endonuclease PdeM [Algoriphagus sp. CAU 1675]MDF2157990.1 ligase-associated DNA damage response endonuclease PdeM [Algoriphagus sp. CAU 1675]
MSHLSVCLSGVELVLLKEKAVWLPEEKALLIADLHFGKASHFRKSGIPIPEPIHDQDFMILKRLIETFQANHVYFLGDLFHSDWNAQWETVMDFLSTFPDTNFHLIKGNHDILSPSFYTNSLLEVHSEILTMGQKILSHEPLEEVPRGYLNICGHIHPGIRLQGKARQNLRIPCFYYENHQLILPAFGNFTGLFMMKPNLSSQIYGVAASKVIPILS